MSTASVPQFLKEQYSLVEEYANAQSRLWNAAMSSSSSNRDVVADNVEYLDTCRCRVRSNFQQLLLLEEIQLKYPQHVDLSRRVIHSIASNPSWHPNGIPTSHAKVNTLEVNTVALVALKVSISRICELEDD